MNNNLNEVDTDTVTANGSSSIVNNIVDRTVSNNNHHDETISTTTTTTSSSSSFQSNATHSVQPPSQQHQQQQYQQQYQSQQIHNNNKTRPIRILIISMGGIRQEIILKMFDSYIKNNTIEIQFSNGIISRELRTRTTLFKHCYHAKLIPEIEYNAYIQYIQQQKEKEQKDIEDEEQEENNDNDNVGEKKKKKKKTKDDENDDWTQCFRNIPINPNRRRNHYNNNANDQQQEQSLSSLHYCVELWRKVKTINRGRTVLACLLAHLIALYTFVHENYDILLEDNIRCLNTNNTDNNVNYNLIQHIYTIIHATTTTTTTSNNNYYYYRPKCHMRYYGWLGSIPNLQWIYHTYIPKYINQNKNENNNVIVVVPCPKPSDVVTDDNDNLIENDDENDEEVEGEEDVNDITNDLHAAHVHAENDDCNETTTTIPNESTIKNSKKKVKSKKNDMTKPGGTNIVWGTYAYWISYDAYEIIIETLQNDIGAIVWKSKRMRYYHVKPIDKIIPRIIRNHFDTNMNTNIDPRTRTTTTAAAAATNTISCSDTLSTNVNIESTHNESSSLLSTLPSSCIYIPICPIFFRAPMLSSNIHQQYDSQFCLSTHYQLQQLSLQQQQEQQEALPVPILKLQSLEQEEGTTTNRNCTYHNLYLSSAEQMVVNYAQQTNYTIWKTPNEILEINKK